MFIVGLNAPQLYNNENLLQMRKTKTCKNPECKREFTPQYTTLQAVCSPYCARVVANIREKKKWTKKRSKLKEELMTHKDWVKKLTPIFNKYIRLRDKNKGCISCGKPLTGKYDAGHCFPAGHYANLRFNEDNVHGQCVECNQHLHGNQSEYLLRLPDRIGKACYERLLAARNHDTKHSIIEIKEMIERYKAKVKLFKIDPDSANKLQRKTLPRGEGNHLSK